VTVAGLSSVPPWILAGVALGAVASTGVALVFVLGSRLAPPQSTTRDETTIGSERRRGEIRQPVVSAFSELGLPTDADADAVKRAYRERVKDTHPDRGGDEEAFRRVQEAYATASDHAEGTPARERDTRPSRGPASRRETAGFDR